MLAGNLAGKLAGKLAGDGLQTGSPLPVVAWSALPNGGIWRWRE